MTFRKGFNNIQFNNTERRPATKRGFAESLSPLSCFEVAFRYTKVSVRPSEMEMQVKRGRKRGRENAQEGKKETEIERETATRERQRKGR